MTVTTDQEPRTDNPPDTGTPPSSSRWRRWGWLLAIWSLSVLTLGAVALLMRGLMNAIGLETA